ncbi:MAG: fibronectin type III domain-containing protein, partial [Ilumatobacteraceae bacterium]
RTATAITAGYRHTCAVLDIGNVKCWGNGVYGRLGQGDTKDIGDEPGEMGDFLPPVKLGIGRTASGVTADLEHTCAALDDGSVKCWGFGFTGRLGQGSNDAIGDEPGEMGDDLDPIALGGGAGSLVMPVVVTPAPPVGVTAAVNSPIAVTWTAPGDDGGAPIAGYEVQLSTDGVTWTTTVADTGSTATSHVVTGFDVGDTVRFRVAAINSIGAGVPSLASSPLVVPEQPDPPDPPDFVALDPARLLDTRNPGGTTTDGEFAATGKLAGGDEIALQITGRGGVQTDAEAVVVNVTVNEPEQAGFVTAYPCGTPRPNASNLNYVAAQTIPNNVVVKLGAGGRVCLYSDQTTNLLADVNGYYPAGTDYTALDPARLLDTRNPGGSTIDGEFAAAGKLTGGNEIELQVGGRGGVPAVADAVILNVTVNDPDQAGFVTAYPCGTSRPNASNLNYVAGQTIPNNVIVKVGSGGQVCLYSDQTTNLIADVNGYHPSGTGYTALDPARILDTRDPGGATVDGEFAGQGKLAGGDEIALQITGRGGVQTDAEAVVVNVTVNEPEQAGFVTAYPCGTPRPNASNLNYVAGQTIPNNVIVKLGDSGRVCLYSDQATNLLADVNGTIG